MKIKQKGLARMESVWIFKLGFRLLGPVHTYPEICENANFFLRIRLASTRIQRIFRPYPEIFENALQSGNFLSDTNTYTCGRSYPQICEYAYVILLDPVFTASIKQTWRTARLCLLC